ncbi:MAG TPA: OsmC family peroxiredoxin [Solirubrobacterales bacterium]|nr:OsmC family peroxiredoxin [Solirubrobacterales bacterium]
MASESSATTVWEGSLASGSGTTSVQSTALPDVAVSWPARTERTPDTTSPEELLAAAHAACYCMGLSQELDQVGHPPERLEATATVSFVPGEGVKSSRIVVRGRVPGVDANGFEEAARKAGEGCPISGALKGNVEITVEATLES